MLLRTALLCVAIAAPALGQTAIFAGPGGDVEIEADTLTYAQGPDVVQLQGHVVVRRGQGLVRAGSASFDRAHQLVRLSGGVLGIEGREVFIADGAVVNLSTRTADLAAATVWLKERPANPDAPRSGKNQLRLTGKRVLQVGPRQYEAEDVRLTPCDCAGDPDYEIAAERARIDKDRAHLSGTTLRLLGAPIPLFPISLPLTNRQSGLLAPQLGFFAGAGFGYAQPVFVTLGQSNDLTITPGLYTGTASNHSPAIGARTVSGPRLGLEWRYAPAEGTRGSLALDSLYDRDASDTPGGRGVHGVRGIFHLAHRTDADGTAFAVQGVAATDAMAVADAEPTSLDRALDTLRTDVGLWHSWDALSAGASAVLTQDVRIPDPANPDRRLYGSDQLHTFQRLPSLFAQLAPVGRGAFRFSAETSATAFAAFARASALEAANGFGPTDRGAPATATGPGGLDRRNTVRLDFAPRLTVTAPETMPVALSAFVGGRADAWLQTSDPSRTRAYALAGARAALPLERKYGFGLHRLEPAVEVRAISRAALGGQPVGDPADAGGPLYSSNLGAAQQGLAPGTPLADGSGAQGVPAVRRAYDEIDAAAPATGAVEATFSLAQSLWTAPGFRALRFDLAQDALLWTPAGSRLGEASAALNALLGPAALSGTVRYDWSRASLSFVSAGGSIHDTHTRELHAGTQLFRGSSSELLRAGIDELFSAARLASATGDLYGSAGAGASSPLPFAREVFRLRYDLWRNLGPIRSDIPDWSHVVALSLDTPCRCAGIQASVELPFHSGHLLRSPTVHFVLDLKSLGSFATF